MIIGPGPTQNPHAFGIESRRVTMSQAINSDLVYRLLGRDKHMSKPKLFIGSSSESLPIAQVLQSQLHHGADVRLWNQGIFGLSDYTLDALLSAVTEFDFALFVFAADDTLKSRGKRYLVARDNAVLELGLFVSRLGRKRAFIALQRTKEPLQLPSDLHGITVAQFEWTADQKLDLDALQPVLGPASVEILSAIQKTGTSEEVLKPLSGGMVFLALLLRERTHSIHELAAPFRDFEESSARLGDGNAVNNYSEKAAKYACQCLQALGMAQPLGGDEFALTKLGVELLSTEKLQSRYANVFNLYRSMR